MEALQLVVSLTVVELRALRVALAEAGVKCVIVYENGFVNYVAAGWVVVAQSQEEKSRFLFVSREQRGAAL